MTSALKEIEEIWGTYLPVSTFSDKFQLLFLRWGWKTGGGTHIWIKSQILEKKDNSALEEKYVVRHTLVRNTQNFLRNLRFEKISALGAPRPGWNWTNCSGKGMNVVQRYKRFPDYLNEYLRLIAN